MLLTSEILQASVTGGSFYGGGGGGHHLAGLTMGEAALERGSPYLVPISEVAGEAILVTVSAVGAPSATGTHATEENYIRAVELLVEMGISIGGFITNECGGLASVNGWLQSAAFGLPVVDAPCNGRAHPTGVMGSMGLHTVKGYMSNQAASGGAKADGSYLEMLVTGSLGDASAMVRQVAVRTGGLVAVARNPVPASYVVRNGAPGALSRCIQVGEAILSERTASARVEAAATCARGFVACSGKIAAVDTETRDGFDVGVVHLEGGFELSFWNEYMTLDGPIVPGASMPRSGPARIATFPDLITTMSLDSGLPVTTAEIRQGVQIAVIVVPSRELILGAGVKDRGLYKGIEDAVGKDILAHVIE